MTTDRQQTMEDSNMIVSSHDGAGMIASERQRQVDDEGYSHEHDDQHIDGEIGEAAIAYITGDGAWWPWGDNTWKPWTDPVSRLVKAGALIAAEIDRLQRVNRGG